MGTKLAQRAYDAHKLIEDNSFKQRAKKLESVAEHGFALILYWNQIEAALKLIRYGYVIKDGWPDKLDFIRAVWEPLKNLKADNPDKYGLVLSGADSSLWKIRNKIAHEGCNSPTLDYEKYRDAALWAIEELKPTIPNLERLREKKRRSDSQCCKNN